MKFEVAVIVLSFTLCSEAQKPVEVSFELIDGWAIVLDGNLGGLHHQKMLVDTGTVPSAINLRVANRLGLLGSVEQFSLLNRSIEVERVHVSGIQVGPVAVDAFDMVAMDLRRIERSLGTRIDAVVGLDLLGRRNLTLDYAHRKLVFDTAVSDASAIAFETRHEAGGTYVVVPLESDGQEVLMLLDTGIKDLMLFQRRLAGRLKQLHIRGHNVYLNAGGKDSVAEVEMQSINIGPMSRHKQKAYVWATSENDLSFDGLLGPAALGASAVAFDFDRHVLSFKTR